MSTFKVGDKVRRLSHEYLGMRVGQTATVAGVEGSMAIFLKEFPGGTHAAHRLELVESAPTGPGPHKHAELIKAWADGAQIQCQAGGLGWVDRESPAWNTNVEYRVKPNPPKVVVLVPMGSGVYRDVTGNEAGYTGRIQLTIPEDVTEPVVAVRLQS